MVKAPEGNGCCVVVAIPICGLIICMFAMLVALVAKSGLPVGMKLMVMFGAPDRTNCCCIGNAPVAIMFG